MVLLKRMIFFIFRKCNAVVDIAHTRRTSVRHLGDEQNYIVRYMMIFMIIYDNYIAYILCRCSNGKTYIIVIKCFFNNIYIIQNILCFQSELQTNIY